MGRRQNEIEAILDAMALRDFIAFKRHNSYMWDKLLGTTIEGALRDGEWIARKHAYKKVWLRRVHMRGVSARNPACGREARQEAARVARGQGKSKNR